MDNTTYYTNMYEEYDEGEYPQEPVGGGYNTSAQPGSMYDVSHEPAYSEGNVASIHPGYLLENEYTTSYPQTAAIGPATGGTPTQEYDDYSQPTYDYAAQYPAVSHSSSAMGFQQFDIAQYPEQTYEYESPRAASPHDQNLTYKNTKASDMEKKSHNNMRNSKKHQGPPASSLSVFPAKVDSASRRKSRKQFTEEEKKKVEAVRSIGACVECSSRKRTVGSALSSLMKLFKANGPSVKLKDHAKTVLIVAKPLRKRHVCVLRATSPEEAPVHLHPNVLHDEKICAEKGFFA